MILPLAFQMPDLAPNFDPLEEGAATLAIFELGLVWFG